LNEFISVVCVRDKRASEESEMATRREEGDGEFLLGKMGMRNAPNKSAFLNIFLFSFLFKKFKFFVEKRRTRIWRNRGAGYADPLGTCIYDYAQRESLPISV